MRQKIVCLSGVRTQFEAMARKGAMVSHLGQMQTATAYGLGGKLLRPGPF